MFNFQQHFKLSAKNKKVELENRIKIEDKKVEIQKAKIEKYVYLFKKYLNSEILKFDFKTMIFKYGSIDDTLHYFRFKEFNSNMSKYEHIGTYYENLTWIINSISYMPTFYDSYNYSIWSGDILRCEIENEHRLSIKENYKTFLGLILNSIENFEIKNDVMFLWDLDKKKIRLYPNREFENINTDGNFKRTLDLK